jgi:2-polyprenyl-6-methoxyphenol hydroxylase-like FAD-dependent oxidoreductase
MILIVGAGPTGLVLGCELARRGVPFRLIDRAETPFAGSRAKGLSPRTLEVFDDLGVVEAILAAGGPFPPFRAYRGTEVLWDKTVHELAGFSRLAPSPATPYTDFWMVPQFATDRILAERLAALGGQVERGTELVRFEQDAEGVTAWLRRGEREERVRATYMVGADGGRSRVRKGLEVPFVGETLASERSLLADVRAEGVNRDHWHMWTHPTEHGRRVVLCPLPGTDLFQFVAPLAPDETPEPSLALLQRMFSERSGLETIRLTAMTWASVYGVNIRLAERWRVGRVFLAGDAAHVHSPAGGQGLNTSVQDAYNLGWKLAAGTEPLLASYEAERRPVAAAMLGLTTALHRRGFQDPAVDLADDVYQLNVGYRAAGTSGSGLQAGDRAPDGVVDGRRLFELFRGPHFSLLAFGRPAPELGVPAVALAGDPAYAVPPGSLVLVRPDGYVGLVTSDPAEVAATLAEFEVRSNA